MLFSAAAQASSAALLLRLPALVLFGAAEAVGEAAPRTFACDAATKAAASLFQAAKAEEDAEEEAQDEAIMSLAKGSDGGSGAQFFFVDPGGVERGPFCSGDMVRWWVEGYFDGQTLVRQESPPLPGAGEDGWPPPGTTNQGLPEGEAVSVLPAAPSSCGPFRPVDDFVELSIPRRVSWTRFRSVETNEPNRPPPKRRKKKSRRVRANKRAAHEGGGDGCPDTRGCARNPEVDALVAFWEAREGNGAYY